MEASHQHKAPRSWVALEGLLAHLGARLGAPVVAALRSLALAKTAAGFESAKEPSGLD